MTTEKEYLISIKENGLSTTWQNILNNDFPNSFFTEDKLGGLYEMGLAQENKIEKKSMGKYYTPDDVAKVMAQYLLELPGDNICDLCCGTGNLIFAVLNELGEQAAKEKIQNGNIYLYDIDNIALNICLAILKNRYGDISNINVINADCLDASITFPLNSKIISNPPYGKNPSLINTSYVCAKRTKELYVAFFEKVLYAKLPCVFITPHSFLGGNTFKELRKELYGGKIFAFDNVPGNIFKGKKFGIFNSNEANSTRAAISILNPNEKNIYVAPFIRYKNDEREKIISKDFLETLLPISPQFNFGTVLYRIAPGTETIVTKWTQNKNTFNNLLSNTATEYKLDIPNTCRYFTTASKRTLKRSGKITVYCKTLDDFYLAYAFINSSLCYYWHRMCNGGITYPITLLKEMPIFGTVTPELKQYCDKMLEEEEQYIVLKKNAGVYQENIKFPMEKRFHLTELLLKQLNLSNINELKRIHNNSCLTQTIDNIEEEDEE